LFVLGHLGIYVEELTLCPFTYANHFGRAIALLANQCQLCFCRTSHFLTEEQIDIESRDLQAEVFTRFLKSGYTILHVVLLLLEVVQTTCAAEYFHRSSDAEIGIHRGAIYGYSRFVFRTSEAIVVSDACIDRGQETVSCCIETNDSVFLFDLLSAQIQVALLGYPDTVFQGEA